MFMRFVDKNKQLLAKSPQRCLHRDFYIEKFVLMTRLGVIDFNRGGFGEPWMDFHRILWALKANCFDFERQFSG